ncbi:alpha/beta fold hydrolase [Actinokineospora sp. 24-640]
MFPMSDGTALHVEDSAAPDAPATVLLSHGWTSDRRVWDALHPLLTPHARVIRFDHRGHGQSAPYPAATLASLGDDLAELITTSVPTGRLVLVGHSMGGMAMMALAARHPDLVRSRVHAAFFVSTSSGRMSEITFGLPRPLVKAALSLRTLRPKRPTHTNPAETAPTLATDPAGTAPTSASDPAETAPKPPALDVTAPAEAAPAETAVVTSTRPQRKLGPLQARAQRAFLRWLLFGTRYDRADLDSVAAQLAAVHRRSAAALRTSITRHAAAEALRTYRDIPTQVLTGSRDRLIPAEHSRVIATELPNAELVVYDNAGHMLPYERTTDLATRITTAIRD